MPRQQQQESLKNGDEPTRDGFVAWDHKGLVVRWTDGHCSYFPWTSLRQCCPCSECCQQQKSDGARLYRKSSVCG